MRRDWSSGAPATWAVTAYERQYWPRNVQALGEFADPPPWK